MRIPAADVEKAVVDRLLNFLQSPVQLLATLHDDSMAIPPPEGFFSRLIAQASTTAQSWRERIAEDRTQLLRNVIEQVIIHTDHIELRLLVPSLVNEVLGSAASTAGLPQSASIDCPFRHVKQGRAVRLVIGDTSLITDASRQAILKAIARALCWYEQLTTGEAESIAQFASLHSLSPRFIYTHLKLIPLSSEWIEKMISRPNAMPLPLDDLLLSIPMNWNQQVFGAARS